MTATLAELAALVGGRISGDSELTLVGAETLAHAGPAEICFVDHPKLKQQLPQSEAAAVLVPDTWGDFKADDPAADDPANRDLAGKAAIFVADVRDAFAKIVAYFHPPLEQPRSGISPAARIATNARLADDVEVAAGAVIGPEVEIGRGSTIHANVVIMGRCKIGEDVTIYPAAVLYRDTQVGDRVVIHAGAAIGAYGFGYDSHTGRHIRSVQLGYVILEDDVEIGANTTVDRGTYGATIVGEGTKVDNLVMIAHNCRIGRHNLICSQVGIAGSSTTGDYVVMAGQVGVPDHTRIGHQAILGAKSGVMRDVPDGMTMLGIPATPERDQMAKQAALAKLPEMRKQLRALQRQVDALTTQLQQVSPPSSSQVSHEAA